MEFIYNRNENGELMVPRSVIFKQKVKSLLKFVLPNKIVKQIQNKHQAEWDKKEQENPELSSFPLAILNLPNKPWLKFRCRFSTFRKRCLRQYYRTKQEEKVYKFTFLDGNYKTRRMFTHTDYQEEVKDADLFITGSDQIWNPYCGGFNPMMFLEFVNDGTKCVAYSSSIARPSFPREIESRVKEDLSKFQHIAVREQKSVEILSKLLGRNDIKLVVDPTMLLSRDQWATFADKADLGFELPEKYIFCYLIGPRTEAYEEMVANVKKQTGIDHVINVTCYGDTRVYGDGIVYKDGGPYEWVYLLSHASIVCMDSFHATVFALKFHKDFVHILKTSSAEENAEFSQNGRMYDILSRYGLLYKLYNKENTDWLKPIDYQHVDELMNAEIEDSLKYLKWEIEN